MKHIPKAKCFICGQEKELFYVKITEWVCLHDKERVEKFFRKIKKRGTRKELKQWIKENA